MRTVKLFWKPRSTKAQRAAAIRWTKEHYDEVKDAGEYLRLKVQRYDTKYIWIFMLSKAFKDLE